MTRKGRQFLAPAEKLSRPVSGVGEHMANTEAETRKALSSVTFDARPLSVKLT
ncbi:Uncharacterised protein [Mycobacteroides abscessus subsp. abscessus]|nr:Uncharacterised protein [Mycobacteroides abscessus subsp. abscessus]